MAAKLANLVVLGFFLSLDNVRTSVLLGPLRLRWRRVAQVAVVFGIWDGLAPLAGLLLGHYIGQEIATVADYVGPLALGCYGLFLLARAWRDRGESSGEMEDSWTLFGLPLPLSVDNLVGGASLGLLGFPPWFSAAVFGGVTAVMSFAGMALGRLATRLVRVRVRFEVLTGVALVLEAIVLGVLAGLGIGR